MVTRKKKRRNRKPEGIPTHPASWHYGSFYGCYSTADGWSFIVWEKAGRKEFVVVCHRVKCFTDEISCLEGCRKWMRENRVSGIHKPCRSVLAYLEMENSKESRMKKVKVAV